jgi:crotonobetainyl-CoA:carnitine CoA-transferase CaiB-like acyl-CoA transferase
MSITGEPSGDPMKAGVALADILAGKDAAIAVLGALVRKERTGQGGRFSVSLADSARAALVNVAQNALVSGRDARRWGNAHPNLVPYEMFHAADRGIVVAVGSDAQWVACCRALGLDELADDPALATNTSRLASRERIVLAIARRVGEKPAAYWAERLTRAGVPNGLVQTVLEALRDSGASPVTGVPPSVPGAIRFDPPGLDEHGSQIRADGWAAFRGL